MRKSESHGRNANTSDYLTTGYGLKKIVHPDSEGDSYSKIVSYPWPLIRLSELYLNYAEALNEANGPSQEIYNSLNKIRERDFVTLVNNDPSDNQKYLEWMIKVMISGFTLGIGPRYILGLVKDFHEKQQRLPKKDLYQYSGYHELEKTLKNLSLVGSNPFTYAYNKLKESYGEIFGIENIIDDI